MQINFRSNVQAQAPRSGYRVQCLTENAAPKAQPAMGSDSFVSSRPAPQAINSQPAPAQAAAPASNGGLFGALSNWFSQLFSRPQPELARPVEV